MGANDFMLVECGEMYNAERNERPVVVSSCRLVKYIII